MGCGKSTLGRKLARRLGIGFVDTTRWSRSRREPPSPMSSVTKARPRFREAEREALERAIAAGGEAVVSTGGGLPTWGDNMQRMNGVGHTVFCARSAAQIASRLKPLRAPETSRLRGLDDAGLVAFMEGDMAVREPFYAQAQLVVDCDAMSDDQVVEHILRQLGLN